VGINKLKTLNPNISKSNTIFVAILAIIVFASIGAYVILKTYGGAADADYNNDNTVNITDLSILATNWGKTNMSHSQGDANTDGIINILDLSILATYFGQIVTPTPTSTPTPTPIAQNTYNVKDYGAKGDGVTDDAQTIRNVIDKCATEGGGIVYIPSGTYKLVTGRDLPNTANAVMKVHIPLRSGCTVKGDGIGKTILLGNAPETGLSVMGASENNVAAQDLTSMIPVADKAATWKSGLKLVGITGGRFTNLRMENTGTASNAVGSDDLIYDHCISYNTKSGFMVDLQDEAPNTQIIGITFTDCESSYSSGSGGSSHGFSAYIWDSTDAWRVSRVKYIRCYAHDNENTGFYTKWSYLMTYLDCISNNNGWGFYAQYAKDYYYSGCTASGNAEGGNAIPYNAGGSNARSTL
jgi:hypothetical protein